jgi:prepilin-type N-terminal cleavage/methylation domain-containing protein
MAQKYTILKAITRTSNKGFTLLELLVGMIITLIIGGLAMEAFINASSTFSKDKKSIDSNQNLSAVLEIIGNDIRQSGENISDASFPTIEFNIATATNDPTLMAGSSKIIIRRALTSPLTLCEPIAVNTDPTARTKLIVGEIKLAVSTACQVGTSTSQLLGARTSAPVAPSTVASSVNYTLPLTSPAPTTLLPLFPAALRNARDYRCELYNPNPATPYDSLANATQDFCTGSYSAAASQTVRVAVSDANGHMLIFNETGEQVNNSADTIDPTTYTGSPIQYSINVDTTTTPLGTIATANNNRNKAVAYSIGNPIYLIEERVYTLDSQGNLQVSIDGGSPSTLIKRIGQFNVSARRYIDVTNRVIDSAPITSPPALANSPDVPAAADICADAPTAAAATTQNPQYICKFNYNTAVTDPAMSWKKIAGVRINLQAKYDGTGGISETSTAPSDVAAVAAAKVKLSATAEFFPRNVLSK